MLSIQDVSSVNPGADGTAITWRIRRSNSSRSSITRRPQPVHIMPTSAPVRVTVQTSLPQACCLRRRTSIPTSIGIRCIVATNRYGNVTNLLLAGASFRGRARPRRSGSRGRLAGGGAGAAARGRTRWRNRFDITKRFDLLANALFLALARPMNLFSSNSHEMLLCGR